MLCLGLSLPLAGCMEYGPVEPIDVTLPGRGLFISNEGNFTYGNASLSYYDITHSALVTNEDGSNDIFTVPTESRWATWRNRRSYGATRSM